MTSFLVVTGPTVWTMVWGVEEGETPVPFSWYLFVEYLVMIVGNFTLINLLVTHMLFVVIDKTTIEWQETKELGHTFSYWGNFSIWYTCLQRSLGTNPLLWLLPTRISMEGDGITFHKPFFRRVPRGSKDDPAAASTYQGQSNQESEPALPEMVHSEV